MRVSLHTVDGGTVVACEGEDGGLSVVAERGGMTALMTLDAPTVRRLRDRRLHPARTEAGHG
jgi:hypothetical protein